MDLAKLETILRVAGVALSAAHHAIDVANRAMNEKRDPTPEEWKQITERREAAEAEWAALAPK